MTHPHSYSEDHLIQAPTAQLLEQELGWESVFALDEGGNQARFGPDSLLGRSSDREVVLTRDVLAALKRLNPGLPDAAYTQALQQVLADDLSLSLMAQNQAKYRLLRDGVPVQYRDSTGRMLDKRLRLIDFANPANNRYLAVRELWVRGRLWLRRADVVCFVNGLPLVFIELKRLDVPVDAAFKQNYSDYLDSIPQLFYWNQWVVLSNGHDARYGCIGAGQANFYRCKRLDEDDPEPAPDQPLLPLLLRGMLHQQRLLDWVQNFILFDSGAGQTHKIIARNHQFLGVNRVIARLSSTCPQVRAELADGQLGVFWHTQGSGKSYSMVFLTEKIHRTVSAGYTFVIVTDRTELDDQIASTYTTTGCASSKSDQAGSSSALRHMLREQNRRYVFGLVQKYREAVTEPYSTRADIIVISDEAHRSQYGRLALNMRRGLPNAKFLGFTGTPLMEQGEKELTRQVFGDYVSIYDFQRAVADGATLPLFYENAGEKLQITDHTLNQRVADYIEAAQHNASADAPWTEEKEEKLYRALKKDYAVLTAPPRLERVAQHLVDHYAQRWQVVQGGASKALLVCLDKITCVRMYDLIVDKWQSKIIAMSAAVAGEEAIFDAQNRTHPELLRQRRAQVTWMQQTEICVVVSQEPGEAAQFAKWQNHKGQPLDMAPHRAKLTERRLEQDFKKPEHPFRLAIVCAMWLTGFDVKSLATLYLDKPMQGHTLMQAIARVNRVGGGKKHGLILDYNGMMQSLRQALATFAQGERAGTGKGEGEGSAVQDEEQALHEYAHSLRAASQFLTDLGFDMPALLAAAGFDKQQRVLQAINLLALPDERRSTWLALMADMHARHRGLFPNDGLGRYAAQEAALSAIARKLQGLRQSPDISQWLQDLYAVVGTAVALEPSKLGEKPPRYDLSNIDFERLKTEFAQKCKTTQLLSLQQRIEARLKALIAQNPTRVDLYQRYLDIVQGYNHDKDEATIQKQLDDLNGFTTGMDAEEQRWQREELENPEHLTVFDLLQKDSLTHQERQQVKAVAKDLLVILQDQRFTRQWLRDAANKQAQLRTEIIDHLYHHLPPAPYDADDIENRAGALFAQAFHVGFGGSSGGAGQGGWVQ